MGKIFSGYIAIPSVVSLIGAGVMAMILERLLIALILFGIAMIWLISYFVYLKQKICINVQLYEVHYTYVDGVGVEIEGFIWCRHPDGLSKMELYVVSKRGVAQGYDISEIPHSINEIPKRFEVKFHIRNEYLNLAKEEQGVEEISSILCLKMSGQDVLFPCCHILPKQQGIYEFKKYKTGIEMVGKTKKRDSKEIDKKVFNAMLKKASQPIK